MGVVDDMLDQAESSSMGRRSKLSAWLDNNPEDAKIFWDLMAKSKERGIPFATAFKVFKRNFPQMPDMSISAAKRVVDAHPEADD